MQRPTRSKRSVSAFPRMTLEQFERRELLSVAPVRFHIIWICVCRSRLIRLWHP